MVQGEQRHRRIGIEIDDIVAALQRRQNPSGFADLAIKRMRTGLPVRFETASGDVRIEGALVDCDENGRATACETVRVRVA